MLSLRERLPIYSFLASLLVQEVDETMLEVLQGNEMAGVMGPELDEELKTIG